MSSAIKTASVENGEGPKKLSLERRLFLAHRNAPRPKPKEKEILEALAFYQKTEKLLFKGKTKRIKTGLVVDVAGSHGLLALLYLVFRRTKKVVILDPHRPPSFDTMCEAWRAFYPEDSTICYTEAP